MKENKILLIEKVNASNLTDDEKNSLIEIITKSNKDWMQMIEAVLKILGISKELLDIFDIHL
ncbi:MAG: hypothetical protein H6Q15_2454 [Bacteroidetes bacterium]|nr:hypothetical protein [Bacteroidota bacterium]